MSPYHYVHDRCREDGDCWLWQLSVSSHGVPVMHLKDSGKLIGVRRFVALKKGLNIEGLLVTNTCGNNRCVCPAHVLVVTKSEMGKLNVARTGYTSNVLRRKKISDAKRKTAKLSLAQAIEVRNSTESLSDIAEKAGISRATASRIRNAKMWKEYGTPFDGIGQL